MQATRFWAAAFLVGFVSASSPGCGKDEQSPKPSKANCNDCGGEGGSGDGAGLAGASVSASGSSMQPNGGAGAAAIGGDAPGGTGTNEAGGGQGGTAGAGAVGGEAGGGASSGDDGEQLQVCARLANGSDDAFTVQSDYTSALYADCRVRWLFPSGQAYIDWANQLRRFSFQFWGCPGTPRVYSFALVSGTPALSQGDVNLLIDHYLAAAQAVVDLTSLERQDMQAALARLSKPLIVDPSLEPSQPACATGGAGGADSGGSAGAGGVDAGGSGGTGGVDTGGSGGTGGVDAAGSGGTSGAVAGVGGTL
jgi:hypothetical protein